MSWRELFDWPGITGGAFGPHEPDTSQPKTRAQLRLVGQAPTREEFAAWQDHPISQMVFAGLERNAEECEEAWLEASWGQGTANQQLLTELRTRADALRSLVDAPYEAWVEILGLEPKNEE